MDKNFINIALEEAKKAYKYGEIPVGAVIVKKNKIVSKAYNQREIKKNVLKHAEMIAIELACKKLNGWRLDDCIIYTTLFPCPMCASAIQQARIKKIVYVHDTTSEYVYMNSKNILESENSNHKVEILKYNISNDLINNFFKEIRNKNVSRET